MIKTLSDYNLGGKLVLLRVDINAPVVSKKILDEPRIDAAANTIKYLLSKGAKVAILAHQGRKNSKDFLPLKQHSLLLSKKIRKKISYVPDLFGQKALNAISNLSGGEAILLENVRFYGDEEEIHIKHNRYEFLSKLFDLYINDAFSVSHREQGSIIIPPKYIESCIGPNFEKELSALSNFNINNNKKNIFLLGGSKIEDYLPLFNVLENKNNLMLVSGVLANLILISLGADLGYENKWAKENSYLKFIQPLKQIYDRYSSQIVLPLDFAVGNPKRGSKRKEILLTELPSDKKIWDVGHKTISIFKLHLDNADSIFMKGPLGFSEMKQYSYATVEILRYMSKLSKNKNIFSLLGGGHLTTTLSKYKIPNSFSYISLSGGALIKYISGESLPGLSALDKDAL